MGNYAVKADLTGFLVNGEAIDLSAYSDDQINDSIALAEELIEKFTDDIFYELTATYKFDGKTRTELFFSPKVPYKLLSVTSVKEIDVDGSTVLQTYTEGTDFIVRPYVLEAVKGSLLDRPRTLVGSGGVWPRGQNNIVVEGTWGNSTTPAAIKRATILLALEDLVPGSTGMQNYDVKQRSWPDLAVTFKGFGQSQFEMGNTTGYPTIDRMLRHHMNDIRRFVGNALPDGKELHS